MHRWQVADDMVIAGDSWGDPDGPLVLLQHGGGQTRHAWKGAGEKLGAAGYHAIALDARGHGDSQWHAAGDYSQDAMVADLVSLCRVLGKPRPVLVGASMGGGVSLVATGEDHIDAAALVLVDIAPRIERTGVDKIRRFMDQKPDGFDSLEEVAAAIASYQPHRPRPRKLDGLAKNVRLGTDGKYHWHWDPSYRNGRSNMKARYNRQVACAEALTLPVLLVRGGLSDVLTEKGAQSFLTMCPHAEYVRVKDAAHMVAGDRNDVFVDSVVEFLARTVPIDAPPIQPPHVPHPNPDPEAKGLYDVP